MLALRRVARALGNKLDHLRPLRDVGFRSYRSPLIAALAHRGYRYTLSADLRDCFPSTTPAMIARAVGEAIPPEEIEALCPDGAAQQGMPTSPILVSLALRVLDEAISQRWRSVRYTRYADDLAFSAHDRVALDEVRKELPIIAERLGWHVHEGKWRLMDGARWSRIVCGVAITPTGEIRAARKARRKLRAAGHKPRSQESLRGLREWVSFCSAQGATAPPVGTPIARHGDDEWDIIWRGAMLSAHRDNYEWSYSADNGHSWHESPRAAVRRAHRAYTINGAVYYVLPDIDPRGQITSNWKIVSRYGSHVWKGDHKPRSYEVRNIILSRALRAALRG